MAMSSVLVSVSGEANEDQAVMMACEMVKSSKGYLHIVYVTEVERALPVDAEIAPSTARGEEILKHMESVARRYKCKIEAELIQARQTGTAIVQEAVEKNVDAIVIGVPYKEKFGTFSLGDTIPYVLKNAPCEVIVWRDSVSQGSLSRYTP